MVAIACPACGDTASVIRFGRNRSGTERLRCKACGRCFTPDGRPRKISEEKRGQIEGLLAERTSQRGIARALSVGRDTIRAVRRRGQSGS